MKLSNDIITNLKSMLSASVKNDLEMWKKEGRTFMSPDYDDYQLVIDSWASTFELAKSEHGSKYGYHKVHKRVVKYRKFFMVVDKEVNECADILTKYFTDKENSYDNNFYRGGVEQFQKSFLKDVRKEKIKKLDEN